MRRQRLGRFGPEISLLGVRWPGPTLTDLNWLLVDLAAVEPSALIPAPDGWAVVVLGADEARVEAALVRLGREVADVVLARGTQEWPCAVALAEAGRARCVGVATDDPEVVERCRLDRHVDVVWACDDDETLHGVCRWGGTGLLQARDALTPEQVAGLSTANFWCPGVL